MSTLLIEAARDHRAASREETARRDQRKQLRDDRRDEFELKTLHEVQSALADMARATGRMHYVDTMIGRQTGSYASTQLPEGVSDVHFAANRRLGSLEGLILDDRTRTLVRQARRELLRPGALGPSHQTEADMAMAVAMEATEAAERAITERIRELYAAS